MSLANGRSCHEWFAGDDLIRCARFFCFDFWNWSEEIES